MSKDRKNGDGCSVLFLAVFDTVVGPMIAVSDDEALMILEFFDNDCPGGPLKFQKEAISFVFKETFPIKMIQKELRLYFSGKLKEFKTPLKLRGTEFQKEVWSSLMQIPYGETRSYSEQAKSIGKPLACRVVACAVSENHLMVVIPCHRIIHRNGKLGGYRGGVERKQWLVEHEK